MFCLLLPSALLCFFRVLLANFRVQLWSCCNFNIEQIGEDVYIKCSYYAGWGGYYYYYSTLIKLVSFETHV